MDGLRQFALFLLRFLGLPDSLFDGADVVVASQLQTSQGLGSLLRGREGIEVRLDLLIHRVANSVHRASVAHSRVRDLAERDPVALHGL